MDASTDANLTVRRVNDNMADVIEDVRRSLVRVTVGNGGRMGSGAGTIWRADGLIITNAHVVGGVDSVRRARGGSPASQPGAFPVTVTLNDGRSLPARILATDTERDIAAIAIDANNLPTVQIGDSRKVRAGQWVFAVGHPWGVVGAASGGVVIGSGSDLPEITSGRDWIVINLKVRPGNSGGPLVDYAGRLIGINTLLTGNQAGAAVPVHQITSFLKETPGGDDVTKSSNRETPFQTV